MDSDAGAIARNRQKQRQIYTLLHCRKHPAIGGGNARAKALFTIQPKALAIGTELEAIVVGVDGVAPKPLVLGGAAIVTFFLSHRADGVGQGNQTHVVAVELANGAIGLGEFFDYLIHRDQVGPGPAILSGNHQRE